MLDRSRSPSSTRSGRKAKRENRRLEAVQLRPEYHDVDESVALSAALSKGEPGAGSVGLSNRPVEGEADAAEGRAGLG